MQEVIIDLADIITDGSWASRWFWRTGKLQLAADTELANPNTNPVFILSGVIAQQPYNLSWERQVSIGFRFEDPIELAMRLSEHELINADQVVRAVKEAIRKIYGETL